MVAEFPICPSPSGFKDRAVASQTHRVFASCAPPGWWRHQSVTGQMLLKLWQRVQLVEPRSAVSQCSFAFGTSVQNRSGCPCRLCCLAEASVGLSIRSWEFAFNSAGAWDVKEALHGVPPWRPVPRDVGSECKPEMIAGISNVLNLSVLAIYAYSF